MRRYVPGKTREGSICGMWNCAIVSQALKTCLRLSQISGSIRHFEDRSSALGRCHKITLEIGVASINGRYDSARGKDCRAGKGELW